MTFSSLFYAIAVHLLCRIGTVSAQFATEVVLEQKLSGLGQITDIQNAGDDRLFVVARSGEIRVIQIDPTTGNIVGLPSVFLGVPNVLTTGGSEQGLLGLAFHPQFATNGHFFINYISSLYSSPSKTVISRFTVRGDNPNVANITSELVIAEIQQPLSNHNGGQMHFWGGYLYISTGDGGGANDPSKSGQNGTSLLGKMLRVNVDDLTGSARPLWKIPASNPFVGNGAFLDEIWAYGLRNPWRFSFDRLTGNMWIADVGQNQREEVDFQSANSFGGENYGWGCCEGLLRNSQYQGAGCGNSCAAGNTNNYVVPAFEYNRTSGVSITGGYVYRGSDFPSLNGTYFYADYGTGRLWGARPNGSGGFTQDFIAMRENFVSSPTTFGEDKNGELYIGTLAGVLHRMTAVEATPAPTTAPAGPATPQPMVPTPMPTPQPTFDYIGCPPTYDESVELTPGLTLSYAVRTPQDNAARAAYGGILCVQLVSDKIGWVGFASSEDGLMPGSQAVIGRVDSSMPMGTPNPGKWYLATKSAPSILDLMPSQTLIDATILKNATDGSTTLTFTKLLIEQGEITINVPGNNKFLWARGNDDASFDRHVDRDAISLEFCLENGHCGGGTECNPRVCTSFTCQDGSSPCSPGETCVLTAACIPCDSCNNYKASCESSGCSYQSNVPACASNGSCQGCDKTTCTSILGCSWKNTRGCRGSPTVSGGTCSGTNPAYTCEMAPTTPPPTTPSPTPQPTEASIQCTTPNLKSDFWCNSRTCPRSECAKKCCCEDDPGAVGCSQGSRLGYGMLKVSTGVMSRTQRAKLTIAVDHTRKMRLSPSRRPKGNSP